MNLLKIRRKKKKATFNRQEYSKMKKLKAKWRRPKGRHSKLRKGKVARGRRPSPGFSSPRGVRGLTREGLQEVRVSNSRQLDRINVDQAVVIASSVGRKKREEIIKAASEKKLRVLNI